jgi:hypothetical protein
VSSVRDPVTSIRNTVKVNVSVLVLRMARNELIPKVLEALKHVLFLDDPISTISHLGKASAVRDVHVQHIVIVVEGEIPQFDSVVTLNKVRAIKVEHVRDARYSRPSSLVDD